MNDLRLKLGKTTLKEYNEAGRFFKEGEADFYIYAGYGSISKTEKPMVVLDAEIIDSTGKKGKQKLHFVQDEKAKFFVFELVKSLFDGEEYLQHRQALFDDEFDFSHCIDRQGKCILKYAKGSKFPNVSFVPRESSETVSKKNDSVDKDFDDEINF